MNIFILRDREILSDCVFVITPRQKDLVLTQQSKRAVVLTQVSIQSILLQDEDEGGPAIHKAPKQHGLQHRPRDIQEPQPPAVQMNISGHDDVVCSLLSTQGNSARGLACSHTEYLCQNALNMKKTFF